MEGILISVLVALLMGLLASLVVYIVLWIIGHFPGVELVDDLSARRVAGVIGAIVFILTLLERIQ